MLVWAYYLGLAVACFVGLLLAIAGLPGIWLMVLAAGVYAVLTGGDPMGLWGIVVLIALGVVAELLEAGLGGVAAARAGGSKRGMLGAIVGGLVGAVVGTPFFPIIGTVVGACVGSFMGAFVVELAWLRKTTAASLNIGTSAAIGKLAGILIKVAFGGVMMLVAVLWALPLFRSDPEPPPMVPAPTTAPTQVSPDR